MGEVERQAFHFFMGICAIALVLAFGAEIAAYIVASALVIGLALIHLKLRKVPLGPIDGIIGRLERPGVMVGYGAATFTAASLAIMTMLPGKPEILASLVILGFGDAASTAIGMRGKNRLPYNKRKTFEGSLAFFAASLPAALFAGWGAVLVAALAALAESLESRMDDNLIIAVVCIIAFRLILP